MMEVLGPQGLIPTECMRIIFQPYSGYSPAQVYEVGLTLYYFDMESWLSLY